MTDTESLHKHDEHCDCGCHDHDHEHMHEHDHEHGRTVDGIHVEHHVQDEACVASGEMILFGTYSEVQLRIKAELEHLAKVVNGVGGIIGHIKASAEVKQTDMFSVTDATVMMKTAPSQEIEVKAAAIVFAVDPEQVETLVLEALKAIKG